MGRRRRRRRTEEEEEEEEEEEGPSGVGAFRRASSPSVLCSTDGVWLSALAGPPKRSSSCPPGADCAPLVAVGATGASTSSPAVGVPVMVADDSVATGRKRTPDTCIIGTEPATKRRKKKTKKQQRTDAQEANGVDSSLASPPPISISPAVDGDAADSKLEFFLEGLKVLIRKDNLTFSKERYNAAKGTATLSRDVTFSHASLHKLVQHRDSIDQELKRRDKLLAQGLPEHQVWFLHLEQDVNVAISYYKGKNILHLRRYEGPDLTPTQHGVTFPIKVVAELSEKTSIISNYFKTQNLKTGVSDIMCV